MNVRSVSLALVLAAVSFGCGSKKSEGDGDKKASPSASATAAPSVKGQKAALGSRPGEAPFAPGTQGFKFQNYGNEEGIENLTATEIKRMFGPDACAHEEGETCILTPAAEQWMQETNKGMNGGHCEGLATMALLMELVATGSIVNRGAP